MEEITLNLEAVTPIFIAGADQQNIENEGLRAPSLRGLLRWWFRALAGGNIDTIKRLKDEECKIFGSTDKKSTINVVSQERKVERARFKDVMSDVMNSGGRDQGHKYLWFSMTYGGNENREIYLPGSTFTITLRSNDTEKLNITLGSLWCVIYLGGIGTRSRRGGGSLKVTDSEGVDYLDFVFDGESVNSAKRFIEDNLQKIFGLYSDLYGRGTGIDGICILKDGYSEISLINEEFRDFRDALGYIGEKYRGYRRHLDPWQRYILGLPIVRKKPLPAVKYKGKRLDEMRHSSPLFFGVIDLNGKYTIRITKFFTSIHRDLKSEKQWVRHHLTDFDSNINEIPVLIPEVSAR
ncbi:MAG TPA: type III-B CRISPR module RAMP protein Cmr1 [Candidatus Omnitrophica bacterium]|nr:type III-B CRISPR module RAMP protein Cmr1 [Candidatus Omnitrophota bacterium]